MNFFKACSSLTLIFLISISSCSFQSSERTTGRDVKNITAFAKVYGYVKYFHPSDEARQIDWEKLAALGVKKVKKAQTEEELKNSLKALFQPIAPTIAFTEIEPESTAFISTYLEYINEDTTGLKTVAWQHLSVDMQQKNQLYASSRINRKDKVRGRNFHLFQNRSARDLSGNTLRLRAMIKTELDSPSNSQAKLLLRLNDTNGETLRTEVKSLKPSKSEAWTAYSVQTAFAPSTSQITAGVILEGDGKLWVDNMQLETKNKTGGWTAVSLQNTGFENENNGRPVGWRSTVTGRYDYRTVSDQSVEGNSFYMASKSIDMPDFLFEHYPKLGETAIRQLATDLWSEVPLALYSDETHTLPQSSTTDFNRLRKELETIDLPDAKDNAENIRLAAVIIAWNELQHFYPYFDVINTNWDRQLKIALEKTLTDDTQEDFNATLSRMLASTRDGHIVLRHSTINKSMEAGLPFLVDWIEDKVVVTHSLHAQIQPGDIVKSLKGKPATEIVQEQRKQISGSPQLSLFRSLRQFGAGASGTTATVKIMGDEGIKSYTIPRSSRRSNSKMEKRHLPVTMQLKDGIYYVDLTRASMARINNEMNNITKSRGVIFDLRGYPTDNINPVLQHLLTKPDTSNQWMQIPKTTYPDRKNAVGYQKAGWGLTPATPHIRGDVVFITDGRAISYSESLMNFIEHYNLAEIVGQPTAGTNGGVNTTVLPGGYRFGWTGMKVVKHDGSQHFLTGIRPTVPVEKTMEGVRRGKDEFLEKAIEVLNKTGN